MGETGISVYFLCTTSWCDSQLRTISFFATIPLNLRTQANWLLEPSTSRDVSSWRQPQMAMHHCAQASCTETLVTCGGAMGECQDGTCQPLCSLEKIAVSPGIKLQLLRSANGSLFIELKGVSVCCLFWVLGE